MAATAVVGTHPTGKHSCNFMNSTKRLVSLGGDFNISTLAHYFTLSEVMAVHMADR